MPNKNMDGLKRKGKTKPRSPAVKIKYTVRARKVRQRPARSQPKWKVFFKQKYALPVAVFVVVLCAFAGGMSFALQTPKSVADSDAAVQASSPQPGVVASLGAVPTSTPSTQLSGSNIYNIPLQVLQSYFQNSESNLALEQRKVKLKQFLVDHNSPLVDVSDTIATQPHWQLILAISFSESTLGKKCYEFNCSGIGGATNIKSYKSFANWILDFNRLLDQRYNNWTLEEMCGVYVKPCTNNWLSASSQILNELKQDNIN